jgi:hypothetical protein
MSRFSILVLALALGSLYGCGAIFNGTRQTIQATSAPQGAKISTTPATGDFTTPASLSLQRKQGYSLSFELPGYNKASFEIQNHMQGGILALDILFTGLLGVVIDAATGAWYKLSPEAATVALTKTSASIAGPDTVYVAVRVGGKDHRDVSIRSTVPGVTIHAQRVR